MHFIMAIKLGDNAELGAKIDNVEFFSAYCEANGTFRNLKPGLSCVEDERMAIIENEVSRSGDDRPDA